METSRKHGPFDTRWPYWPYPRKDNSSEAPTAAPLLGAEAAEREWRRPPARLNLVPREGASDAVEGLEREEAGTRSLMVAMAAVNCDDR